MKHCMENLISLKRVIKSNCFGDLIILCYNKMATPKGDSRGNKGDKITILFEEKDSKNATVILPNGAEETWERW